MKNLKTIIQNFIKFIYILIQLMINKLKNISILTILYLKFK